MASIAIKIHTFNDLDEVFFKRLISMIKHGINNCKIHPHLQTSNNSVMTQQELFNWIKTDEERCLSTIQEYLQKENLVRILFLILCLMLCGILQPNHQKLNSEEAISLIKLLH